MGIHCTRSSLSFWGSLHSSAWAQGRGYSGFRRRNSWEWKVGEVLLRDGFRLVWLEEQNGSEKKDFHESGGEKKRRRNLGLK